MQKGTPPALSFTVLPSGELGLVVLPELGLRMVVPGHPVRLDLDRVPESDIGFPSATFVPMLIEARDVPVCLRFLHVQTSEISDLSPDPKSLLEKLVPIRARPGNKVPATPAQREQAAGWGVEAAASCVYPLAIPDVHGADAEGMLVLSRGRDAVVISQRFASHRTPWQRWALFLSALNAGIRWSADGSVTAPATFPDGVFLAPGVTGALRAERANDVKELAAILSMSLERRTELARRAAQLVRGSEPPATPIPPEQRKLFSDFLTKACPTVTQAKRVGALVREVRTAHDLRGVGLLLLYALGEEPVAVADPANQGS